ncbi:transporter [Microbacterium sp. zg.B48]|uniref:aspartate:alanine exchanger family transporter n=1 Tax=unclassified Microbacterium TaxID=2609290 RepID=UPI00214C2852|nr:MULTISPECIES: TrkA C-terminal domain-containing protein [unclassified Microbacterium]MCR2764920.1 transporter [Microbacterium sp. zg.B48]MCR2808154.1 transporter [Microbacterium sp. zg.B185]WIM19380.1 TrkA C-terminal domain-containing protein [Microbacterium sp. zg-B185]
MRPVFDFLAAQPVLTAFLLVGLGSALGRVRVGGVSLGAIGVLFAAMGLTAWGVATGVTIELPALIGDTGLVVFAFCVGLIAGPSFGHTLRTAYPLLLVVTAVLLATAATGLLLGRALGFSTVTIAGTFAGAVTNTPALAASGGSPEATVGYASAYVFGVIAPIAAVSLALRHRASEDHAATQLENKAVRIDTADRPTAGALSRRYGGRITFSRLRSKGGGDYVVVGPDTELPPGGVVNVVGPREAVEAVAAELGHTSSLDIVQDRSRLEYRRLILSNPELAGRPLGSLGLRERFGATVPRVRRGDADMLGADDVVLQQGDRLQVVAPRDEIPALTTLIGDSERGMTDINPVALGVGIALGLALGAVTVPLPGGGGFALGPAAGALIAGLVFGRVRRVGPIVTTLPTTAANVLAELGLVLFLAYAGTKAGSLIGSAITSGEIVGLLVLGAAMTTLLAAGTYAVARLALRTEGTRLGGVMAGTFTNPALLGFANTRTGYDMRVTVGYTLVYPAAMVVKILIAQILVVAF